MSNLRVYLIVYAVISKHFGGEINNQVWNGQEHYLNSLENTLALRFN